MATIVQLGLVLALSALAGNSRTATFDEVTYTRQFVSNAPAAKLAEYVRDGETLDNWTTLVAVHAFPHLDDPTKAAAGVIKMLQKTNPLAKFAFFVKEDQSETMIDFITWPRDASYAEFNVFRYFKPAGQSGVVAYQFAFRFQGATPEMTERIKRDRARWVDEMSRAEFPIDFSE